jgi:hypothetical protein
MSEMYDIHKEPEPLISKARSCPICSQPMKPSETIFLPKSDLSICKTCGQDIYLSLAPKAETIQVPLATKAKSKASTYKPFDEKRLADSIKREAYTLLVALSLRKD